ncbi:hypothetical protein A5634_23240 [Mycobacterium asiaticum]|uniref:Uncharacterized protein n=2 Tax=Mycobacterium asiaticum TaxID=1790 RepID=A0A1A3P2G3_MYCAS|nr:hypothetical protein A5634_23240 [Mycobacterium asiaticum]
MENRRNVVESAFQAAVAVAPQPTIEAQLDVVRNACYDATTAYLSATGNDTDSTGRPLSPYDRSIASERAQQLLTAASRSLDHFHEQHRGALDAIAARGVAATAEADAALAEGDEVANRLAQTADTLRGYPSVQRANDQFVAAYRDLHSARERRDLTALAESSRRLRTAAHSVVEALTEAPKRADQARQTMASLRTRLDALRNRVDSVDANRSALLREFHSDSSADLLNNGPTSRNHLDRADELLAKATSAGREGHPEMALELATHSRAELTAAEHLIDAVADRLSMLRELRKDPASKEREVRFRLRDAQRLAVDRGVVKEWGSALDAQAARIDLIKEKLEATHPDYWSYSRELEEVSQFVATIVARIRKGAAK